MLHKPLGLLAELTHRCPLSCPYCSNPLALDAREDELDTAAWLRVFREAAELGRPEEARNQQGDKEIEQRVGDEREADDHCADVRFRRRPAAGPGSARHVTTLMKRSFNAR